MVYLGQNHHFINKSVNLVSCDVTLLEPTRAGYTFNGWFSGDVEYTSGIWSAANDVTLVASWTANSYTVTYDDVSILRDNVTVTYDYNYSGSTSETITLTNGQTLTYPTNPTRIDYVFAGWYLDSSCNTAYDFSGEITEDITLYARWISISNNATLTSWSYSDGVYTSTNKSHSSS